VGRLNAAASVGITLLFISICALFLQSLDRIGPGRVVSCETHRHFWRSIEGWADYQLDDGSFESIERGATPIPDGCLPAGTLIEKRRWELGIRFDGGEPRRGGMTVLLILLFGFAGVVMLLAGFLSMSRKSE
jgi:hypothetical protein